MGLRWQRSGDHIDLRALHGFTLTAASWSPLIAALGEEPGAGRDLGYGVVDLPGHGDSTTVAANLEETADLLVAEDQSSAWLGYSLGGRVALHVALAHPGLVERLVLIGAHPGIEDEAERGRRRASDSALADELDAIAALSPTCQRQALRAFLDRWLSQPLFATLSPDAAAMEQRLCNTPSGLASSLRLAGTGSQRPLWDRLGELSMPILLLAGELDAKFSALARRAASAIGPNAHAATVKGAGHAVHLEAPGPSARIIRHFLVHGRPPP